LLRKRFAERGLTWTLVWFFLPARFVFGFIAQGLAAGALAASGREDAWRAAAGWWMVWLTITDILCLLTLRWLLRREGVSIGGLFGVDRAGALRQLAWTPAYLLVLAPLALLPMFITRAFYGAELSPMFTGIDLPLGWALYAVIIWPPIWAITEELVYLGYLLPRLEAATGSGWQAAMAVISFWGLQHFAMPFIADATYLCSRVLAATAAAAGLTLVFVLWRRRLVTMIGVHYLLDLATAIGFGLLPALAR
jgi:membrane protease YdiL (CAAX protease family)